MKGYEKLIAWQLADEFAIKIYRITRGFPKEELYGITSQLRRAAISVPTNLAEGSGRQHKNERKQFANIALGSLAESEYLIHFSKKIGMLNDTDHAELASAANNLGAVLWGLHRKLSCDTR